MRRYWTQTPVRDAPSSIAAPRPSSAASPAGSTSMFSRPSRGGDEPRRDASKRRETAEHPFGTDQVLDLRDHFQTKTLKRVRTEMALHVLAYNSSAS